MRAFLLVLSIVCFLNINGYAAADSTSGALSAENIQNYKAFTTEGIFDTELTTLSAGGQPTIVATSVKELEGKDNIKIFEVTTGVAKAIIGIDETGFFFTERFGREFPYADPQQRYYMLKYDGELKWEYQFKSDKGNEVKIKREILGIEDVNLTGSTVSCLHLKEEISGFPGKTINADYYYSNQGLIKALMN